MSTNYLTQLESVFEYIDTTIKSLDNISLEEFKKQPKLQKATIRGLQ